MKAKRFVWTVEIEVAECWVADGYEATAESVQQAILHHNLGYASDHEVTVRVLKTPKQNDINIAQGYAVEAK